MKQALLIGLLISGSTSVSAATGCPRVFSISPTLDKPHRKITSPRDPLFGHLIGRSKSEVIDCQGEPAATQPSAWTYYETLGPGAHSFRHSWVVKFRRGKVVEIDVRRKGIGCILIPLPRNMLSRN